MSRKFWLGVLVLAAMPAAAAVATASRLAFFVAPYAWTGEPARLAATLQITPGTTVADIGAGSGQLAIAIAPIVGPTGRVFATELNPARLREIERRANRAGLANLTAVAAGEHETRLADACCGAIYMRAVFHHIADKPRFAGSVARTLAPRGRLGVIDFPPGTLWFAGAAHGIEAGEVERVFQAAGLRRVNRIDHWGGGMYLVAFERDRI